MLLRLKVVDLSVPVVHHPETQLETRFLVVELKLRRSRPNVDADFLKQLPAQSVVRLLVVLDMPTREVPDAGYHNLSGDRWHNNTSSPFRRAATTT